MPDSLRHVQQYMAFIGWEGRAEIGFTHKTDVNGKTVALAHGLEWQTDYEEAQAFTDRMFARWEVEERARQAGPVKQQAREAGP